jgi:hypothetical protein
MKETSKPLLAAWLGLCLWACGAARETVIPAVDPFAFDAAVKKTAKNLGLPLSSDYHDVNLSMKSGRYRIDCTGASRPTRTAFSLSMGWMKTEDGIRVLIDAYTRDGDPRALSALFPLAVKQQLTLEAGKLWPVENTKKSFKAFMARNLASSTWAAHYLLDHNPLYSRPTRKFVYGQAGLLGEWPAWAWLGVCAFNPTKQNLKIFGILYGASWVWKLFMIPYGAAIADYNKLANSPYDFKALAKEY